jgi:hypothetical protein
MAAIFSRGFNFNVGFIVCMFDQIPIWALFLVFLAMVSISIETGYRLMKMRVEGGKPENEPLVSVIAGSGLGVLGFIIAFTFSIVYARFETRKELLRQEANAVRRLWLRSEFMGDADRSLTVGLLNKYLDIRVAAAQARRQEQVDVAVVQSEAIQQQLWDQGVAHAKANSLAGLNAPYLQSINDIIDIHSQRLAIGAQDRIPPGMWVALVALLVLSMVAIGYFSALKGSKRSPVNLILALSFSLLFALVAALDDPLHGLFKPSQLPLVHVRDLLSK